MSLMETDMAKTYANFVELYVKQYNSIIGFLTAVDFDTNGFKLEVSKK